MKGIEVDQAGIYRLSLIHILMLMFKSLSDMVLFLRGVEVGIDFFKHESGQFICRCV